RLAHRHAEDALGVLPMDHRDDPGFPLLLEPLDHSGPCRVGAEGRPPYLLSDQHERDQPAKRLHQAPELRSPGPKSLIHRALSPSPIPTDDVLIPRLRTQRDYNSLASTERGSPSGFSGSDPSPSPWIYSQAA